MEPKPMPETHPLKEQMVAMGVIPGCIDDRFTARVEGGSREILSIFVTPEQAEGSPGFLGASMITPVMLAETAPEGIELDAEMLAEISFEAHEEAGLKVAVHMDDHHGERSHDEAVSLIQRILSGDFGAKIPGCGFWWMVTSEENPLNLSPKAFAFFQKFSHLLEMFVKKGAKVSLLKGPHASKEDGEASAVRNTSETETISREKVAASGEKAPYIHDDSVFSKLMQATATVLDRRGLNEWAENVRSKHEEINYEWLDIATVALAGKTAEVI